MTLAADLAELVDLARAHGAKSIDCHTLETLLDRHGERHVCTCRRPDLLDNDDGGP